MPSICDAPKSNQPPSPSVGPETGSLASSRLKGSHTSLVALDLDVKQKIMRVPPIPMAKGAVTATLDTLSITVSRRGVGGLVGPNNLRFTLGVPFGGTSNSVVRLGIKHDSMVSQAYLVKEIPHSAEQSLSMPQRSYEEKTRNLLGPADSEAMLAREVGISHVVSSRAAAHAVLRTADRSFLLGSIYDYDHHDALFALRRSALPRAIYAWHVLPRVCDEVAGLHAQNIAHRDIKPANILGTRDGDVSLTDFGSAKDGVEVDGQLGTLGFLAPEAIALGASKDAPNGLLSGQCKPQKLDIWAIGATAMAIVTDSPTSEELGTGFFWPLFSTAAGVHKVPEKKLVVEKLVYGQVWLRFDAWVVNGAQGPAPKADRDSMTAVFAHLCETQPKLFPSASKTMSLHAKARYARDFETLKGSYKNMVKKFLALQKAEPAMFPILLRTMHPLPSKRPEARALASLLRAAAPTLTPAQQGDLNRFLSSLRGGARRQADAELESIERANVTQAPRPRRNSVSSALEPRVTTSWGARWQDLTDAQKLELKNVGASPARR